MGYPTLEWRLQHAHLIDDAPHAPDVGLEVVLLLHADLGGEVLAERQDERGKGGREERNAKERELVKLALLLVTCMERKKGPKNNMESSFFNNFVRVFNFFKIIIIILKEQR